MPQVTVTLPNLPDAEALKTGRPAAAGAALPLVQAPGYTLGLRALRVHTQHFTLDDWKTDVVALSPAEVRRVQYRPSPLAQRLWVGAWVGTNYYRNISTTKPAKVEINISIIDNAAFSSVGSANLNPGAPQRPGYGAAFWNPATNGVENSDLNQGVEQIASTTWDGIDITGLNGLDGWIQVTAEGLSILSVTWVELVEQVAP